jgi:hypothetical protein
MHADLHPSLHLESEITPSRNPKSDSDKDDQALKPLPNCRHRDS